LLEPGLPAPTGRQGPSAPTIRRCPGEMLMHALRTMGLPRTRLNFRVCSVPRPSPSRLIHASTSVAPTRGLRPRLPTCASRSAASIAPEFATVPSAPAAADATFRDGEGSPGDDVSAAAIARGRSAPSPRRRSAISSESSSGETSYGAWRAGSLSAEPAPSSGSTRTRRCAGDTGCSTSGAHSPGGDCAVASPWAISGCLSTRRAVDASDVRRGGMATSRHGPTRLPSAFT